jgi:hypothetical protein
MGRSYTSCPTALVKAPVETVWDLLSNPGEWGQFYDLRVKSVVPSGKATIGQKVHAESGPKILRLKVTLEFVAIDPANFRMGIQVWLPFGLEVFEDLQCIAVNAQTCRVNYHCSFDLPVGCRGWLMRHALQRQFERGPEDSLLRLKRAAEAKVMEPRVRSQDH